MSKIEWKKWINVLGSLLLAYALVFAQGAWATQNQATKDKAASPPKPAVQQANEKQSGAATTPVAQSKQAQSEESENSVAEEKPSRDGSREGIKVHGHWTIEVRNPDGTVVTHREFENSLLPGGAAYLAGCMVNGCAQTTWKIRLRAGSSASSICPGTGSDLIGVCDISAAATTGQPSGSIVLNASLTAAGPGSIDYVKSGNAVTGIAFNGTQEAGFTLAFLSAPQSVAAGQILQVTVLISLS